MNNTKLQCIHAKGDADTLVVQAAIQCSIANPTVVIAEDTDILILLLYHANIEYEKIYFTSTAKKTSKKLEQDVWSITDAKLELGQELCKSILILHALLGCDTTSRLFNVGKGKSVICFKKDSNFQKNIDIFDNGHTKEDIVKAGEKLLLTIYGVKKECNLNELRSNKFYQKISSSMKFIEPQYLNPTSASASFHILRVYHQVQTWKGNLINPLAWGYHIRNGKMMPIYTNQAPAPETLLRMIRCGCTTGCNKRTCTCVKYNLKCSFICGECRGRYCLNCQDTVEIHDNSEIA